MSQKYKSNGNGFVNLSKSGQKYPQDRTSKRAFNSNQSQQNSNINTKKCQLLKIIFPHLNIYIVDKKY